MENVTHQENGHVPRPSDVAKNGAGEQRTQNPAPRTVQQPSQGRGKGLDWWKTEFLPYLLWKGITDQNFSSGEWLKIAAVSTLVWMCYDEGIKRGIIVPNANIWLAFIVYVMPLAVIGWGYHKAGRSGRFPGIAATMAIFASVGSGYRAVIWYLAFAITGKGM
jgi:hypothetical protein